MMIFLVIATLAVFCEAGCGPNGCCYCDSLTGQLVNTTTGPYKINCNSGSDCVCAVRATDSGEIRYYGSCLSEDDEGEPDQDESETEDQDESETEDQDEPETEDQDEPDDHDESEIEDQGGLKKRSNCYTDQQCSTSYVGGIPKQECKLVQVCGRKKRSNCYTDQQCYISFVGGSPRQECRFVEECY